MAVELWNDCVLEHEPWLRTVVRSRVASADEADELVQTVLASAIAYQGDRREIRALGPWLYRLALRAVLEFRRRCGRRRRLHQQYAVRTEAPATAEPLELLLGDEQRQLVRQALAVMRGDDVEILQLKYVHGWSYAEISERLGLQGHRVAHRLRRARERLKAEARRRGLDPQ